ncbi:MAG: AtpZ/AtpI family protein [Bacteroidetes bacterium]|nr:AtpZ/AtpI family protein [Bacteroidota bacterium]
MENQKKNPLKNYARYSGIAFQMLVIILMGVFGGYKLDQFTGIRFPVFTVVLSLGAVSLAIYYAVKDFIKNK